VDVPVQAARLVLRQHEHAPEFAVEAVRQREVDDPVEAAEGDGRLGPVAGERFESGALAAGENES
jgi:hypothetical protein